MLHKLFNRHKAGYFSNLADINPVIFLRFGKIITAGQILRLQPFPWYADDHQIISVINVMIPVGKVISIYLQSEQIRDMVLLPVPSTDLPLLLYYDM